MVNETLSRIYQLVPSIGAWARAGSPGPLWASAREAHVAIQEYVGPAMNYLLAQSLHLSKEDIEFLRSAEALNAITQVVLSIYTGQPPIHNGLFFEEASARA